MLELNLMPVKLHNPYRIVQMFEEEVAYYTGAKYAVGVSSCTDALLMACSYESVKGKEVMIPKRTYISVPQSIHHAGGIPVFEDLKWKGVYQLKPFPIYDSAKRFTSNMYIPGTHMCLSFHLKKPICIGKGGMILTDSKKAYDWFIKARYEGRCFDDGVNYQIDGIDIMGWNMYMTPEQAARGLWLLQHYPEHAEDQVEIPDYRDVTEFPLFSRDDNGFK
jgi:dTDP-4-amino-4,6-dideoxygalactose transaminase